MIQPLSEEELNVIYNWVDQIPLTRPKRNIARDFSDGVLMAEIVYFFIPKIIDVNYVYKDYYYYLKIHNYSGANSLKQKRYNWDTLNTKVFKRLGFQLAKQQIDSVIQCQPEAIERVLSYVQLKIESASENIEHLNYSPSDRQRPQTNEQQPQYSQNGNENFSNNENWQKEQIIEELRETIEVQLFFFIYCCKGSRDQIKLDG